MKSLSYGAAIGAVLIAIWYLVALTFKDAILIPTPEGIIESIVANRSALWISTFATACQAAIALIMAVLMACALVLISALFPKLELAISPYLIALKAAPVIAFVPLIALVAQNGILARAIVGALIAFFPIAIAGMSGIHEAPNEIQLLERTYRPGRHEYFRVILWPYILRSFLIGLEIGGPTAIVGTIVGDFVIGGRGGGLGIYVISAYSNLDMRNVCAGAACATALGIAIFVVARGINTWARLRLNLAR